ncbi:myosin-binding protein 2-like isoform X1 [Cucurbita pepo subsp. pepo]|uniref:myosin-binding protein 2-like isoform X1 n=1 Tax=Cucurbita pepo subsp. pepo TaxID=3664 RepID=UPI000C9D51A3|nr:myosin-binding protein 2-like isoform X1 [Cucurbita pepo subsp. pepo]XP_023551659.1 myosin-binding protein 2-like isoform X1 [Cucurbita pepo subsp. pepo]
MAANKFATILHRNSNKFTLILVYALLEWVLIFLLLLQALFSYLIVKFAEWFGLKRPCLWCSRVDHVFEPGRKRSYRDLLCEAHSMEISNLGYCSNHRKLTEFRDLCEDCSSSSKSDEFYQIPKSFPFFGDEKEGLKSCSCCGESLKNRLFSPCILIKPNWGDLDYAQKGDFISEAEIDVHSEDVVGDREISNVSGEEEAEKNSTCSVCGCGCKDSAVHEDDDRVEDLSSCNQKSVQVGSEKEDELAEISPNHLEFYIDRGDDRRLIPVDLINFSASEDDHNNDNDNDNILSQVKDEEQGQEDCGNEDVVLDFGSHFVNQDWDVAEVEAMDVEESSRSPSGYEDPSMRGEKEEQAEASIDAHKEGLEELVVATREPDSDLHQVDLHMWNDELDVEILMGTNIPDRPDHDPIGDIQTQTDLPPHSDAQEDPSPSSSLEFDTMQDSNKARKSELDEEVEEANEEVEFKILSVETSSQPLDDHKPSSSELNENEEEDKVPDTPTSMDSFHQLHKKLLLLDRKESGTEESLDGSIISETESGDGVLTIEKLKSALRTERKALNALYAELEEERSASAIAANQTMAMINRLQEEKASMQMEALQYQRMMEEQSEYDQEALQLLNELVVKREKEKQELEKELEVYRKKLQDYEAKEKIALLRNRKEGSFQSRHSSVSCSNADDSDGLSIDLNTEAKKDEDLCSNQETENQNTPAEAVLYLDETMANFEEERLSILEELKMLEEKLFTLSDEEQQLEDVVHYCEQNGNGYHKNSDYTTETNGFENGHHLNGKHYPERRAMSTKAKRLLPLFNDAVDADIEDVTNREEQVFDSISVNKFDTEFRRVAVEEEVDHVYERLQALEADREFLKHCIGSLKKGDKGIELLQEILQHLRDLRSVDLHLKNMGDTVLA